MNKLLFVLKLIAAPVVLVLLQAQVSTGKEPAALPRAHAHNDYYHDRPLLDALDHGFCSVEADVFPCDGKFLVGHDLWELRPKRTLEALYLKPLKERFDASLKDSEKGSILAGCEPLILLVDLKRRTSTTYDQLHQVLSNYQGMLAGVQDGRLVPGAVMVILSGNRPIEQIKDDKDRLVFLDGRPEQLDDPNQFSTSVMPLVSIGAGSFRRAKEDETRPPGSLERYLEMNRLEDLVDRCHTEGYKFRLWGFPDTPACWSTLYDMDVDLINTDNLSGLQQFLRDARQQ